MTAIAVESVPTFTTPVDAPATAVPPTLACAECLQPIVGEPPSWVNIGALGGSRVMARVHYMCALAAVRKAITHLTGELFR